MKGQVGFLLVVQLFAVVFSYPNGAPSSERVCSSMNAGHGPGPQTRASPYTVSVNTNKVSGGQKVRITVSGDDDDHETFRGLYCQVRDAGKSPIGKFLPGEDYKTGNCGNLKDNAATHVEKDDKKSISLTWQAPQDYQGKVTVACTVLEDFETFWTFVSPSGSVTVSLPPNPPISRIFTGPQTSFKRKRREEHKMRSRKAKILNYNPYAPYPLHIPPEDYYTPAFVQNFQDPFPKSESHPVSLLDMKPKPKIEKRAPLLFKSSNYFNNFNANPQNYHKGDNFNENIPHYYNPNEYKTPRPPILHYHYPFPKEIANIPNPTPVSGFIPNVFPPKGHNHHFYNSYKDKPSILHNLDIIDQFHDRKPLEIREFAHPPTFNHNGGSHKGGQNEFSLIPNAAVLIPSEFSQKNNNLHQFKVPSYGLLVYNPGRGPPHYLIPVAPQNNKPITLDNNSSGDHNFNNNHLDSSRSFSESSPPQIIYGERFTGKNYFFGRKTKL